MTLQIQQAYIYCYKVFLDDQKETGQCSIWQAA